MSDNINVTERILDKLNKIDDAINETKIDISAIKVDLNYHVKRTDLAEQTIKEVRKDTEYRLTKLEKWSDKWHFIGWLMTGLLGICIESGTHVFELLKFWKY